MDPLVDPRPSVGVEAGAVKASAGNKVTTVAKWCGRTVLPALPALATAFGVAAKFPRMNISWENIQYVNWMDSDICRREWGGLLGYTNSATHAALENGVFLVPAILAVVAIVAHCGFSKARWGEKFIKSLAFRDLTIAAFNLTRIALLSSWRVQNALISNWVNPALATVMPRIGPAVNAAVESVGVPTSFFNATSWQMTEKDRDAGIAGTSGHFRTCVMFAFAGYFALRAVDSCLKGEDPDLFVKGTRFIAQHLSTALWVGSSVMLLFTSAFCHTGREVFDGVALGIGLSCTIWATVTLVELAVRNVAAPVLVSALSGAGRASAPRFDHRKPLDPAALSLVNRADGGPGDKDREE